MKYKVGDYVISFESDGSGGGTVLIKSHIVKTNLYTKQYHLDDIWAYTIKDGKMITNGDKNVIVSEETIVGKVSKNFLPTELKNKYPEYFI
jgi:hypothetical protein